MRLKKLSIISGVLLAILSVLPSSARAQAVERLCDPAFEDCRDVLIRYIRAETVGLDVAFWFMEDSFIASEVIKRHQAGVPVRVLMDTQANASTPRNADRLAELQAAGIPMREKVNSGIHHWKMMLFAGQGIVEFSGANFSSDAWVYYTPYENYVDEAIYFTSDASVVNSFRTKYDDLWVNTTAYANYANISGPLTRHYGIFPKDPELNFPPFESFADRSVDGYNAETQKLDVIIYRITDQRHTNAVINAAQRGIPVRLLTEPKQYRDPNRLWHSWNIDRLYMAGVQIRDRAHAGLNHQKLTLYYSQGISVLGSSNWTSPSDNSQEEHNYFTKKPHLFTWLVDHFERKWNNSTGTAESKPFTPLPPDAPTAPSPANSAQGVPATTVTLKWHAGYWAHNYDIYFGTSPQPPLVAANVNLGPSQSTVDQRQFPIETPLQAGTTYYWRIVSKTMANLTASSPVYTFSTEGSAPPPPPPPPPADGDVVLYAGKGTRAGAWQVEQDPTAAGGVKMRHPDAGAAKITQASASPAHYFELNFTAQAGVPYRLWVRGRADGNYWPNDSAFVQFSGSVNSGGTQMWRIGTTDATEVSLEECSGCGVSNWGWTDNGWGAGVLGPVVYFATTGAQKIRVQTREDGFAIDQVVLSPSTYLTAAPGPNKNDTTILAEQTGSGTTPPPGDTTLPTAQITAPSSGATVSGTTSVTVSAADNVAVSRVELLLDGTQIASDSAAPYQFSWNTTGVANGSHSLQARAVDSSNNTGLSAVITVTVNNTTTPPPDTTVPSAQITAPANGATVSGTTNVAVSAADNVAVSRVELLFDGTQIATDSAAPFQFALDTTSIANGSHTLQARAVDSSNNTGLSAIITVTVSNTTTPPPSGGGEIVVWALRATTLVGNWQLAADNTAAGGQRIYNPDLGAAKIRTAAATPADYFEVTFNAEAGRAYRIWVRGKAENNYWANDSVFLQFNGSVNSSGSSMWRIGTTDAAEVNLEEANNAGVSNWGWQDNGWGTGKLGPLVYFSTTGPQRLRIQTREDGFSIDQIVLSPSAYLTAAPGSGKNDNTILPESSGGGTPPPPPPPPPTDTTVPTAQITSPSAGSTVSGTTNVAVTAADNVAVARVELLLDGAQVSTDDAAPYQFAWDTSGVTNGSHTLQARAVDTANNTGVSAAVSVTVNNTVAQNDEIVLWTAGATTRVGNWQLVSDNGAAGGLRMYNPDLGAAKIVSPSAAPSDYFEMTFNAVAGRAYRIWVRGKAENNYWANDSVFLQFSGSVNSSGASIWRIGTTSATEMNLEETNSAGVSNWGWQDNGWGAGVLGPLVYFNTTGPQTLRIQVREDGLSIDQIVLSPAQYLSTAPGSNKNDTTLLGKTQ